MHQRRLALFERQVNPAVYDRLQQFLTDDGVQALEIQHVQQAEEAAALVMQRESIAIADENRRLAHIRRHRHYTTFERRTTGTQNLLIRSAE